MPEPPSTCGYLRVRVKLRLTAGRDRNQRLWLWEGFGQSLVAECKPKPSAPFDVVNAVMGGEIDVEITTLQDNTHERVLRSEEIDVDHLSPPLPR